MLLICVSLECSSCTWICTTFAEGGKINLRMMQSPLRKHQFQIQEFWWDDIGMFCLCKMFLRAKSTLSQVGSGIVKWRMCDKQLPEAMMKQLINEFMRHQFSIILSMCTASFSSESNRYFIITENIEIYSIRISFNTSHICEENSMLPNAW